MATLATPNSDNASTKIKYGSMERTEHLDDDGSTKVTTTNLHGGIIALPVRMRYTYNVRVHNKLEEQRAYCDFSDELEAHPDYIDPDFRLEKKKSYRDKGYYYAIKSYTVLQY